MKLQSPSGDAHDAVPATSAAAVAETLLGIQAGISKAVALIAEPQLHHQMQIQPLERLFNLIDRKKTNDQKQQHAQIHRNKRGQREGEE